MEASSSVLDTHRRLLRSVSCSTRPPLKLASTQECDMTLERKRGGATWLSPTTLPPAKLLFLELRNVPRHSFAILQCRCEPPRLPIFCPRKGGRTFVSQEGFFFKLAKYRLFKSFPGEMLNLFSFPPKKIMLFQVFFQVTPASPWTQSKLVSTDNF